MIVKTSFAAAVFEPKPISPEAIPQALAKAERYRLLDEPDQAESICRDILNIQPDHQDALVVLILSLTDQSKDTLSARQAQELLPHLADEYERNYYAGLILERLGRAHMNLREPGYGFLVYQLLREAMVCFEMAEEVRPAGNDDSILRWNACVRTLNTHSELRPRPEDSYEPILGE